MTKRITRILAGLLCLLLVTGILPLNRVSDLFSEIVPELSTEAEAAAGASNRITGLFFIRDNGDTSKYMTNSDWYLTQSTFETKKSGNALLSQMWLIITGNDNNTYIRSLSDVMANQGGTYGNRWLSWDHGWNGTTFPTCKNIDGTVSAEPGNPTGGGTYKWAMTSISAKADGSYTCYIKESSAAYYIQNVSGKVQTGRALGNTAGTLLYLEPCYDPMFENARPLQLINQPSGNTSYKLNNSSSTSVAMAAGTTNTANITWAITKANNGYWYIINRATGNYLVGDQVNVGGSVSSKAVASNANPANDASIQWQIIRQRYTTFTTYIIINKGTGLILQSNGSAATTSGYNFGSSMHTYWTLGYNIDHGEEVPETPQFYNWNSTARYFPAKFSGQPGYVALRANQAKSIDGDLTGYLFDTAAMASLTSNNLSLSSNSTNHFMYNSAYAGSAMYPNDHSLGTTTMYFSFPQSSSTFFWLIGNGTEVTANVNGTKYSVTDGIKKVTLGTSGTGTISLTATGHFGIFTNVTPTAQSADVKVTMSGTNNQVIHSDTTYTVTVTNNSTYAIDNVCFTVSIGGGHDVTLTVSNGGGSSSNSNIATITASGSRYIDAGKSANWTITMKPGGMTGGKDYTITANAGTYISYNSASAAPNASNTIARGTTYSKALQECNGGNVTATVTTSPNGGTVNGSVTYTIKITNGCNHAVSNISFTFGNSSTTILKVVNGSQNSKHSSASVSGLANSIGAGATLTITVTVNFSSGFTAGSGYQFAVSSGSAASGCSSSKTFSSTNSTSVTTVNGGVKVEVTSNVSNGAIVRGNVVYTIKFTNNANHDVNKVDFILKAGSTALLTITDGAFTKGTGVSTDVSSIGTITKNGGTAIVKVTVDTTKLAAKTGYTIASSGGYCEATGLAAGSRGITITGTGNVQTITTASGTGMSIAGGVSITSGMTVEGEYYYDITVTNGANHAITGIDYIFYNGSTAIVTVKDGAVTVNDTSYVRTDKTSLGNVAAGGTVTLRIYIDTTKLSDGSSHTFKLNGTLSCNAAGISGGSSSYELTATASYSHSITVRKGDVTMTWTTSISAGSVVEGTYTYKVTFTNGTNHKITGIDYIIKYGNTTVVTVSNGSVTASDCASANKQTLGDLEAGASVELIVTIDTTKLTDKGEYTFTLSGGSSNATGLAGSNSGIELKPTTNSYSHNIIVRGGNVVLDWSSIASGKVVEGTYNYTVTFKNEGNHKVVGIDYIIKVGNTNVITVSNGQVTVLVDYLSVDKSTASDLAAGATDTLVITVDTTKLTDGQSYTFYLVGGTATASGIVGSNSDIELNSNTNKSHSITVRGGDISVELKVESVIGSDAAVGMTNGAVAEDKAIYTITFTDGTNHNLKDIVIVLRDSEGNALVTYSGSTLVKNSELVTDVGTVTVNGKVITISGITVNAKDDSLDTYGYLTVQVAGSAKSSDVVGSGENYPYDASSDTFTIMVRHDVNLLVQSGVITNIDAEKILAAMGNSGAEIYAGIDAISAVTVTDINGNTITKDGFGSNGSNLVIKLVAEYSEYIIKVTYSGGTILVPIQVTTIDAGKDETKVLDYGLPVSISKDILLGDVRLTGGAYANIPNAIKGFSAAMPGEGALTLKGKFGSFSFADNAFSYVTNQFMTDEDVAYIVILVGDATGKENVDYVNVYKKLSFIPSNVIYYEDTLTDSIDYPIDFELVQLGELAATGESLEQDLPETGNMGFDDGSYANSQDVMISGESVHKVTVNGEQVTVSFTITGTGFELISRVNAKDAATLLIYVTDSKGETKIYPVITRFDPNGNGNAEVYQVPVFRLNNGEYDTYEVQVVGLPMQEFDETGKVTKTETSYIYIDGIRVYNPLGLDNPLTNNYGVEQGAEFTNLRDLILAGQGMVAEWNGNITGFTAGSYYYLGTSERFTAALGSVNELGAIGANNEILIRQSAGNHMVVLKVQETVVGEGLLQIGIHDIHDAKFDGDDGENLSSTVSYKTEEGWAILKADFKSGTEQYYSIDLSNCPTDGEYKLVILQVDSGFVSFTNIKHKNVEFGSTGAEVLDIYTESGYFFNENGDMCQIIYGDDEDSSEDDEVKIVADADKVLNINTINGILATSSVENETV